MAAAEVHSPQRERRVLFIDQKFNSKSIDRYKWAVQPEVCVPRYIYIYIYILCASTRVHEHIQKSIHTYEGMSVWGWTKGSSGVRRDGKTSNERTSVKYLQTHTVHTDYTRAGRPCQRMRYRFLQDDWSKWSVLDFRSFGFLFFITLIVRCFKKKSNKQAKMFSRFMFRGSTFF